MATLCDLHPGDSMDLIRRAYADGLVQPGYIGMSDVERSLALDRAEAIARSIADPQHRAKALADLALALARAGSAESAKTLICAVWTSGGWAAPLDALARAEPAALLALGIHVQSSLNRS